MNTVVFHRRASHAGSGDTAFLRPLAIFYRRPGWRLGFAAALSLLSTLPSFRLTAAAAAAPAVNLVVDEKTFPSSPGYHVIRATAVVGMKRIPVACGLFLPKAYFQPTEPMPVVVTLHNRGASGGDGGGIDGEGLGLLIARNDPDTRGTGDKPAHPIKVHDEARFIALAPQCPPGNDWHTGPVPAIVAELITHVTRRYRADPDRVYLTGFSYGGSSTWKVALALPGRFAAIAPLDGRATGDPKGDALKLRSLPTYLSVGGDDGEFIGEAQKMRDAIVAAKNPDLVYHTVPKGNHWCYASVYTDPEFWSWLFAQRRAGGVAATRPAARAGFRRVVVTTPGPATAPASSESRPAVLCQYFRDLPGTQVSDLTSDAAYPRFPNEQVFLDRLELPPNEIDNFGSVLRAVVRPTQTGEFTFYVAGQDQCELWLGTDETAGNLRQIAQVPEWSLPRDWSADPHQQSNPVSLKAGKPYLIEVRHKHGVGDNHASVAWRLPDGTVEGPIPGSRLSPAPAAEVPPPHVVSMIPASLPTSPGSYTIALTVDYLGRRQEVRVSLVLPRTKAGSARPPVLVYCAAGDQTAEADGPLRELSRAGAPADSSTLVLLSPRRPPGSPWENLWLEHATAAALDKLLHDLPVDGERVYLTGAGGGTTAVWALGVLLPGRFAVIAPISPLLATDPRVAQSLNGTRVQLITGVEDGMATDRANRMKDALAAIRPAPDVAYEMHLGTEVGPVYYARPEFYASLLEWRRPVGRGAERVVAPPRGRFTGGKLAALASGAAAVLLSATIVARRRRRSYDRR